MTVEKICGEAEANTGEDAGKVREIDLNASTEPATDAAFDKTLELQPQTPNDTRVYVVDVEATDPGVDWATTGSGTRGRTVHSPQRGTDTLQLDGDGLPDVYETSVTGTDPLDRDSNSSFTATNETGDAPLDSLKDLDADGLAAFEEYRAGTDPLDVDTDGDDLTDGFETNSAGTDPLDPESVENGTSDADADLSGDGLTLVEEQYHGTNPLVPDTDGDGLTDYEEIHVHGTEPLNPDTSDNGLTDGEMVRLGLDPLAWDATGNGQADGEDTFTTETHHNETGVTVAATGQGVVANGIHVRTDALDPEFEHAVSPMVKLSNTTDFEEATVTIPLSEDADATDDLRVYKWDPATDDRYQPVETEIDAANHTASATIESFSHVVVFEPAASDGWRDWSTPGWPALDDFDDLDGWTEDGQVGMEHGNAIVGADAPSDEATVSTTSFGGGGFGILNQRTDCFDSGDGELICPPFDDEDEEEDEDDGSGGSGGSGGDGDSGDGGNGGDADPEEPQESSLTRTVSIDSGVESLEFHTRLKGDVDSGTATLKLVGEDTTRTVHSGSSMWRTIEIDVSEFAGQDVTVELYAQDEATIEVAYVGFLQDRDGDGFPDEVERLDLRMPAGQDRVVGRPLGLDAARADTDGDGLDDDEEVTMGHGIEGSHIEGTWKLRAEVEDAVSHPSMVITSGGALTDREELQRGTNPLIPQRLKAGLLIPTLAEVTNGETVLVTDRGPKQSTRDSYSLGIHDSSQRWNPEKDKDERTSQILTNKLPTVGPPEWMDEEYDYESNKIYIRIPSTVVAKNIDVDESHAPDEFEIHLKDGRGVAEGRIISGGSGSIEGSAIEQDIIVELPKGQDELVSGSHSRLGKFEIRFNMPEGSVFERAGGGDIIQEADKQYIYDIGPVELYDEQYKTGIERFELLMQLTGTVMTGQGALKILIKTGQKRLALSFVTLSESEKPLKAFADGEVSGTASLYDTDIEDTSETIVYAGPVVVKTT